MYLELPESVVVPLGNQIIYNPINMEDCRGCSSGTDLICILSRCRGVFAVVCKNCGASSGFYLTKKEAVDAWNGVE